MRSTNFSFKRWLIGFGSVGALTGLLVATSGRPAAAEVLDAGAGGCSCTITGTGSYACSTPSACSAGFYTCAVNCSRT